MRLPGPENSSSEQEYIVRHFKAPLTINQPVSPSWMLLGFAWPEDLPAPLPGQFFTFRPLSPEQGGDGLLRRPLAFAGFEGGTAYSLYQVRGPATRALAAHARGPDRSDGADSSDRGSAACRRSWARRDSRADNIGTAPDLADMDEIDILGPLGNSFPLPEPGESAYLVGGGCGCGPIVYLYSYMRKLLGTAKHLGGAAAHPDPVCVLGFRTSADVPAMEAFAQTLFAGLGAFKDGGGDSPSDGATVSPIVAQTIYVATDDGSAGLKGNAVESIAELFACSRRSRGASDAGTAHFYACGPAPMLRAAEALAARAGGRLHVSAEQWMACGVGACQGCAIPLVRGGYARVCADGPVFGGGQIDWEKL